MGNCGISPWNRADNDYTHEQIEHGDEQHRKDNRTRDVSCRVLNFSAEIGNVVIAAIVIHRDERRTGEPVEESFGEMKDAWRKIECHPAIEVNEPGTDHPEHRSQDNRQHNDRETSYGLDRPIEQ